VLFLSSFITFHCQRLLEKTKEERQKEAKHASFCGYVKGNCPCLVEETMCGICSRFSSAEKPCKYAFCNFIFRPPAQKPDIMLQHA
jgi:hypothetical protein